MNILFVSQYFPPEMGAPAARMVEFSRRWAGAGHSVSVLTAFPHHPVGKLYPGHRIRFFHRSRYGRIRLFRSWIYITANKGIVRRSFSYLSFAVCAVINSRRLPRQDVLIATSPQFLCALAGFVISKLKKMPFILEIRDLWPDSIVAVGAMQDGLIIAILKKIERFLYKKADKIVVVTESFRDYIIARGISEAKIVHVPNGIDSKACREYVFRTEIPSQSGMARKLTVAYIGTMGMAHGLETVLEAAIILKDVLFLLIGEGAEKDKLMKLAERNNLRNVIFIGRQPREQIPGWIRKTDACIVHLKNTPLFDTVIPSKIFEIMGCGRPLLLGTKGESRRLVEKAKAGFFFEPEDRDGLVSAIRRLIQNPQSGRKMGASGRRFVQKHYDLDHLAEHYLNSAIRPVLGVSHG